MIASKLIEKLSEEAEIVQYAVRFIDSQSSRDFLELRCHREANYLKKTYAFVVYSSSVENENIELIGDVRANIFTNFYLIELEESSFTNLDLPLKCKLHQLYQADWRGGFSLEWYNEAQSYFLKRNLLNLKNILNKSSLN